MLKNVDKNYRHNVKLIFYTFENKLLNEVDLEKVKEELRATEIGRSLIEESKKEAHKLLTNQ